MGSVGFMIMDCLVVHLSFFLPAAYMLTPRKGNRYVNWFVLSSIYDMWMIFSHYAADFSLVIYPTLAGWCIVYLLFKLLYRDSPKRRLEALGFFILMGLTSDLLTACFLYGLIPMIAEMYVHARLGEQANLIHQIGNLMCQVVCMTFALVGLCLIRKRQVRLFLVLVLIPVYQFVMLAGFYTVCNDFSDRVALIGFAIGGFNFAINIFVLYVLGDILKKKELKAQLGDLEEIRRREYAWFEAAGRSAQELRMIRHDFSNHLQALYKMMGDPGSRDTVKRMMEEMERQLGETQGAEAQV